MHNCPSRGRRLRFVLRGVALTLLLSCGADQRAIRLILGVDAQHNSEQQVLDDVDRIWIIVTQRGGFGETTGGLEAVGETPFERGQLLNDDAVELVMRDVLDGSELPKYRLVQGEVVSDEIRVAAYGLKGPPIGDPLALTAETLKDEIETNARAASPLVEAKFQPVDQGEAEAFLQFDLLPTTRPPRVERLEPADGSIVRLPLVETITIIFSTRIDPATLGSGIDCDGVTLRRFGSETCVAGHWRTAIETVLALGIPIQRTRATFRLDCPLAPGAYSFEIPTSVMSADTPPQAFDRTQRTDGAQSYNASFAVDLGYKRPANATWELTCLGCRNNGHCQTRTSSEFVCSTRDGLPGVCMLP